MARLVYVSFSGGKDSTVLLDLVRQDYPDVPAVFCDTGLEYPEIREFVKTIDNVVWLKPKMNFRDVLKKYGYPVIGKETAQKIRIFQNPTPYNIKTRQSSTKETATNPRKVLAQKYQYLINSGIRISEQCCDVMKKRPFKKYEKLSSRKPFIGMMAGESSLRRVIYIEQGCNAFNTTRPSSNPMMFWLEEDVWQYIREKNLPYSSIYDMGYERTGCMFCAFGAHMEQEPNRFQRMHDTHPKQWKYCMDNLGMQKVLDTIGVKTKPRDILFY